MPNGSHLGDHVLHVLLVEDDELNARAMSRWLDRLGYQVTITPTRDEAIRAVEAGGIDVALLDITLNGDIYAGLDVARRVRAAGIPASVISGSEREDVLREAMTNALADVPNWFSKPLSLQDLHVLHRWIEGQKK